MSDNLARIKSTFRDIAEGKKVGDHFGLMVQSAISAGLTSKSQVAEILGVQPAHVFCKANALKGSEVRDLCKKLNF